MFAISFAEIATRYGVTRERVRQWHLQLLPGAPRGHQRRRLCIRQQQKRELLTDPVFRHFYRHARAHSDADGHPLITSAEPGETWAYCFADDVTVGDGGGEVAQLAVDPGDEHLPPTLEEVTRGRPRVHRSLVSGDGHGDLGRHSGSHSRMR